MKKHLFTTGCNKATYLSEVVLWRNGIRAKEHCKQAEERAQQSQPASKPLSLPFIGYPNPANEQFQIQWPQGQPGQVRVSDQLGQLRFARAVQSTESQLNISTSQLPAGVYFVEIQLAGAAPQTLKLVVQH